MRKTVSLLLVLMLVFTMIALSGCGGGEQEKADDSKEQATTGEEKQEKEKEQLKIAALLPGPISDQGWNMIAYKGLKRAEEKYGAKIAYTEKVPPSDYEEIFRGYASQGYDIVMGHGFEFGDAAMKVAPEFPDVVFVVTSTNIHQEPNVASLNTNNLQQGFLQGVVAALVTEKNIVGAVGGMEIPPIMGSLKGYEIGAKYINTDIKVLTAFTGNFEDAAKAKEMANAMIEEGVDVLMQDADHAGLGVIEAAKEAGIYAIGANGDQENLAPETIVTSGVDDLSLAFEVFVKKVLNGEFQPKAYEMGVQDGVVYLAPFRDFEDELGEEKLNKINQIVEDIKSGKLVVEELAN